MSRANHMTVAEWTGEWLDFSSRGRRLDIGRTVENLRQAEDVLIRAAKCPPRITGAKADAESSL